MSARTFCQNCGSLIDDTDVGCPRCAATVATGEGVALRVPDPRLEALAAELRATIAPALILLRQLGHGGMGTVFLARDPVLKRSVVVKVLSPELAHDENARRRFEREAESAAAVSHPNVVNVYQVGALPQAGTSYFVMRYVEGVSLDAAFPLGTLVPEIRAKRVIGEVASALAAAHARGLAHRDIKPANIMMEADSGRAVVVDFGISAAVGAERRTASATKLTQQGVSIGTPQYMSPEQAAGDEVTDRSDVYSLGLVAFELLTGRAPFEDATPLALAAAHIHKLPPSVSSLRHDADPSLAQLVDQCLAKDPTERPSASSLAAGLLPQEVARIEWPPPGLDAIHGTASRYLSGITRFAVVVLAYAVVTGDVLDDLGASGEMVGGLLFLGALTALWYAYAIGRRARHLPRAVADARRVGFPRTVVLDVVVDDHADTELLINRAGPFARLNTGQVNQFMRRRRYGFVIVSALVVLALFGPAAALLFRESQIAEVFLGLLAAAGVARWRFGRPERQFRRRYLRDEGRRSHVTVGPDLVTAWLAAAGSTQPDRSRHPWPDQLMAGVFNSAIAVTLLVGLLWLFNLLGMTREFKADPPGSSALHFRELRDAGEAARRPFPALTFEPIVNAAVPAQAGRFEVLLRDTTMRSVERLARSVEAALRGDSGPAVASTSLRQLELAAAYGPLDTWRTLASDSLPMFWYQGALEVRRKYLSGTSTFARPTDALSAACQCNRPLREIGRFATLQAASAMLAAGRGDEKEALHRAAELIGVGRNLVRDPLTAAAGSVVLGKLTALLDSLAPILRRPELTADAASLATYRASLDEALGAFAGMPAIKAMVRPVVAESLLALAGDRSLQPVYRRGLARAAVLGACYQGTDIFFNVDREREQLLDSVLARVADLPESEANAAFARDLDWRRAPELRSWMRVIGAVFWTVPRVSHCESMGLLRDSTGASPSAGH